MRNLSESPRRERARVDNHIFQSRPVRGSAVPQKEGNPVVHVTALQVSRSERDQYA